MDNTEFRIKFSTLFTDLKTRKSSSIESVIILCSRRFLLVLTTVFFNRFVIVSFYSYFYSSLWLLNYYITHRPFEKKWVHHFEIMNEVFVMIATYFIICFSEFLSNI